MSPFSVQTALALLYCGAKEKTATAMRKILQLERLRSLQDVANNFYYLLLPFENDGIIQFSNGIYINSQYNLSPGFQYIAEQELFSNASILNFSESVAAAQTMNDYVSSQTSGKITDVISSDCLSADTGIVVVNAIYFDGSWVTPFNKRKTVNRTTFYTSSATSTLVDMMHTYVIYKIFSDNK